MAVESAVKSLSGVSSVEVNLDQQTAKIVFDDAKTNLEQVRASIKDAGYEPQ
ncbi:MAG: heavy-metal-associated domain-containing protein [Methylocystaceae bacterium]